MPISKELSILKDLKELLTKWSTKNKIHYVEDNPVFMEVFHLIEDCDIEISNLEDALSAQGE